MSGLSNPEGGNVTFVSMKRHGEQKEVKFLKREKVNGEWAVTETYTALEGWLRDLHFKSYEWEGSTVDSIVLTFHTEQGKIVVEMGFSLISRSLLNGLIGTRDMLKSPLKLSLYVNKKGFNNLFAVVIEDGQEVPLKWAYPIEKQPKPKEITFKGKVMRDYTELDEWFKQKTTELLIPVLQGLSVPNIPAPAPKPVTSEQVYDTTAEIPVDNEEDEDDLPF